MEDEGIIDWWVCVSVKGEGRGGEEEKRGRRKRRNKGGSVGKGDYRHSFSIE